MLFVSKVTGECTRILAAGDQIPRGTGFREMHLSPFHQFLAEYSTISPSIVKLKSNGS